MLKSCLGMRKTIPLSDIPLSEFDCTRMYSGKSKEAVPMCSAFFLIEGSDD
jgi:hypothetical protein